VCALSVEDLIRMDHFRGQAEAQVKDAAEEPEEEVKISEDEISGADVKELRNEAENLEHLQKQIEITKKRKILETKLYKSHFEKYF
jgi:hypothetical protein